VTAHELYGRESAIRIVEDLVGTGATGGGALMVRGQAGVGKSSILAAARARADARGMGVLSTTGVYSEMDLPFAGLHQLLQPLLADIPGLPALQRDALEGAFGMSDGVAPELFLIALATLELLADAGSRTPVLVIAEDVQWLDPSTSEVLAFVARRVSLEPIVLLAAIRDGWASALGTADLRELRLDPLAIYTMRVDGGDRRLVTRARRSLGALDWQPVR